MDPKPSAARKRPWYHPLALARRLMFYYMAMCVALFFLQNYLLYPRWQTGGLLKTEEARDRAQMVGCKPWDPTTPGATGPQGYVQNNFTQPAPRGTIIVFHGNGGWALQRMGYVETFAKRGFRTFLYEYPGYGGRPGRPSEATIVPDAQAVIRSLDQGGYGPVYVWGESLGSGAAAAACADPTLPVHGLALFLPWDTLTHVALAHYPIAPVGLLLQEKYDSIANLEHFPHPVCIIRSEHDEIIPAPLTLNLYAHLPGAKRMIVLPDASHNDWLSSPELSWWDDALDFIAPKK